MLLNLKNLSFHIGTTQLLDAANLTVNAGERICLIGRNGTGKSTLLKLIAGELQADSGEIQRDAGLRMAWLSQEVAAESDESVYDVIARGLGEAGALVAEYHHLLENVEHAHAPEDLDKLSRVQAKLEACGGWSLETRVQSVISRLQLPGDTKFSALSGGLKRRTLLGQALVQEPDVLLLDEPTNHLDIDSIRWLEEFLLNWTGTLIFVTHDRAFLRRLATQIVELDRGTLRGWPGTYDDYLIHKQEALHAETQQNALFDKRLAQEEVWIRQGIQARRTRNEGRVRALKSMREEFRQRRVQSGAAKLTLHEAERSGKLVAEIEDLNFAYGDKTILKDFSTAIMRGDKIGIVGPNGAGKTTVINLLLGKLKPTTGKHHLGTKLNIAYFDQLRTALDPEKQVYEIVSDGKDYVEANGQRRHVMSYLQDFLFTPDRVRSPVKSLSGGERSRLLLARLFSHPSNLLVLDEPTNDLDIETLDLLEELVSDYQGTALIVSHDREFLNNIVTRCLVFEGDGRLGDYIGGYDDWLRQRPKTGKPAANNAPPPVAPKQKPAKKLNYKEQRELATLPALIEKLETEQAALSAALSDPKIYQGDPAAAAKVQTQLTASAKTLAEAYRRWEALEAPVEPKSA